MKKVEFVHINSEVNGYGLGKGMRFTFHNVEKVIRERITDGWEYLGYVPLETRGTGDIEKISLIFTKE